MNKLKKKILVIDDIPENTYNLKERLSDAGYEVRISNDGRTGIESAISETPDLIICDIMMPDINGYQVMNILKGNPRTAEIPFIFLSAKSGNNEIRAAMNLGADDFITKPFNSQHLLKSIRTRLKKKALQEKTIESLKKSITHSLPHELQTPLTAILGFTELLIQGHKEINHEEVLDIANNIKDSANRLNDLVQKILFLTKLDSIARDNRILSGNEYVIQVVDHGTGMTSEQTMLIGEFIQFDRMLYEQKGTGLGLSIVKKMVEIYNGRLSINSIPGKQTLVSINLPVFINEIN